jgi:hypothetical protein
MKPVSTYLHQHINPNKTNSSISTLSRTFLSSLFHNIHQGQIQWNEQKTQMPDTNWENYHKNDYEYIPVEIRKNWIEKAVKDIIIKRKFVLNIRDKKFNVFLWFPTINRSFHPPKWMTDTEIENKIMNTIERIYVWLFIATSFLSKNTKCSKEVNIYLYLTHHSKFLPTNSKKPIDQLCANTAFTTGCYRENTNIFIFREEEWFKVLIHETFHNLGMDFIDIDNHNINKSVLTMFPISVIDLRIYETYAELWAEIMNILFIIYYMEPPKKKGRLPLVKWIQLFNKMVSVEQEFTIFQAKKVLNYHKLKYADLFMEEKAKLYHETTQVFSYYILKSIWMIHINEFIEFCAKQPNGYSLKFHLTIPNLEKFVEKMKKLAKTQEIYNRLMSDKIMNKEWNFANTTLRMTLHELE